jgi:hypothetical protein
VLRLPAARVSDSSLEDDSLTGEASTV